MSDLSTLKKDRPITMAILAMGGEGGGVLADWAVDMAERAGYWAQTTSVPGVAQRTGTTVYYLEFFPQSTDKNLEPILSTMPTPGEVDIVLASELMEAGRAVFRGFVTPETTTLIASTHRVYSMTEKTAMADGRVDSAEILKACESASKKFVSANFSEVAEESGTVISAALFGALAGSQSLPFSRDEFTAAIERSGVGVKNSIIAFEKSFAITEAALKPKVKSVSIEIGSKPAPLSLEKLGPTPAEEMAIIDNPVGAVGPKLRTQAARIKNDFPEPARLMLVNGIKRTADYQDVNYATLYLDRLEKIRDRDRELGNGTYRLLNEVARYTALWMTYEDTIRVADLKVRRSRFNRVGKEARINNEQIMQVREYLHPGIDEISDTLPTPIGRWLLETKTLRKVIERITREGIRLHTTSLHGYIILYTLSRLKFIRRRSLRFNLEQERIEVWLTLIYDVISESYDLACEITECANVIKGYGETHANGWRNYLLLMEEVVRVRNSDNESGSSRIAQLRTAAMADETGTKLRESLSK